MKKAVFLDRDGTINELFFNKEFGLIDSPLNKSQVKLLFGIEKLLNATSKMGFKNIVVTNQPAVALAKTTVRNLELVKDEINRQLRKKGVTIDYFAICLHHPFAKISKYKKNCNCRKPKIALFKKAAKNLNIDLKMSWMIGDGVDDIIAGKKAGCRTILIANISHTENFRIIEKQLGNIKPDYIVKKLPGCIDIIKKG